MFFFKGRTNVESLLEQDKGFEEIEHLLNVSTADQIMKISEAYFLTRNEKPLTMVFGGFYLISYVI